MDTLCKDCVFAEWHGNKQSDCKLERLFKFENQGANLVLEESDGKQYARIVGRFCNACREKSSLDGVPSFQWQEFVRNEVKIPIAMAVYVDSDNQFDDACTTLESMINQSLSPQEIILIYNVQGTTEVNQDYPMWFFEYCDGHKWRIQLINGLMVPFGDEIKSADYGESVDLSVQSDEMKAIYFTVCKAGYQFPLDYIETIDKAINDDMERFVALLPDEDGNGLLVQRRLHKLLQGNKKANNCNNIIDKITQIANEEGTDHMVKRFEDIKQMVD